MEIRTLQSQIAPPTHMRSSAKKEKWRLLTSGEVQLLKEIFQDGIDYSKVHVHRGKWWPLQPDEAVMTPLGNIYYPPNHPWYSEDFSEASFSQQYWFIHEMTHVYQYQQGVSVINRRLSEGGIYDYRKEPDKSLNEYTVEQQGMIIADYFRCTRQEYSRVNKDYCKTGYEPALSKFFKDPNYLRDEEKNRFLLQGNPQQQSELLDRTLASSFGDNIEEKHE